MRGRKGARNKKPVMKNVYVVDKMKQPKANSDSKTVEDDLKEFVLKLNKSSNGAPILVTEGNEKSDEDWLYKPHTRNFVSLADRSQADDFASPLSDQYKGIKSWTIKGSESFSHRNSEQLDLSSLHDLQASL